MSAIAAALQRPLGAVRSVALSRRVRRRLMVLATVCFVLAAAYIGWFRNSGMVSVDRVSITGITTRDADRLRSALAGQARSMTTLNLDRERLDEVVAGYPVVRELRVTPDFPHRLHIRVIEHEAAAFAIAGSARVPVAGDGTVLRGLPVHGRLPEVRLRAGVRGDRLTEATALRDARVLGGAPEPLRAQLAGVHAGDGRGLTVRMREGPQLIFGNATRLRAKWLAATRVLADPSAQGATYIDLRVPGRPAVGGVAASTLDPVAPSAGRAAAGAQAEAAPEAPAASAPPAEGVTAQSQGAPPATPQPPAPQPPQAAPQPQQAAGGGATVNPQP